MTAVSYDGPKPFVVNLGLGLGLGLELSLELSLGTGIAYLNLTFLRPLSTKTYHISYHGP